MSEGRPTYDDEIDLFELFKTLWDSKWLISAFVAIALLLGSGFLSLKGAVYESKLIYSVSSIPPFYNAEKVLTDFQNKFYSSSVFEEWKKNNGDISLVFDDYAGIEVVDGFVLSKNVNKQLATIRSDKKGGSFLLIKSNQLPILDDFFEYATHINGLLKDEYIARAKEELNMIKERLKDLGLADGKFMLSIDRFIFSAENGVEVLSIQHPTMPKKVSPKVSLILALSVVLGGIVGMFFILVRNAITKRKEQLAKV